MNTTSINEDTVIPPLLGEMAGKIVKPAHVENKNHEEYLEYVLGWVTAQAEKEYKKLLERDGIPAGHESLRLLCELAIMRAMVRWHEVRDRPPPMPSIDRL